jgi:hypothetical protein
MADAETRPDSAARMDPDTGKRILLILGLLIELVMMAAGLWPAAWLVMRFAPVAETPGQWALIILGAALVFNFGYLVALLLFRVLMPYPREGHHTINPDGKVPSVIRLFMCNVLLVKARIDPPWAAMFSSVLTRVPPLGPLFTRFFGPRTTSVTMGDAVNFLDPHFVEAGKNVEFGFNCTIVAHHFDNRGMLIRRVKIGDHAVIGGESTIMAGVEIGHHAIVGNCSVVRPNTKIGPYEYWAGVPAKKIKDLQPDGPAAPPRDLRVVHELEPG